MSNFFQLLFILKKNKNFKLVIFGIFLLFLPFLEMLGVGLIIPLISSIQDGVYQNNFINQLNLFFDQILKIFIEEELTKKNKIYFSSIFFATVIFFKIIFFIFF